MTACLITADSRLFHFFYSPWFTFLRKREDGEACYEFGRQIINQAVSVHTHHSLLHQVLTECLLSARLPFRSFRLAYGSLYQLNTALRLCKTELLIYFFWKVNWENSFPQGFHFVFHFSIGKGVLIPGIHLLLYQNRLTANSFKNYCSVVEWEKVDEQKVTLDSVHTLLSWWRLNETSDLLKDISIVTFIYSTVYGASTLLQFAHFSCMLWNSIADPWAGQIENKHSSGGRIWPGLPGTFLVTN